MLQPLEFHCAKFCLPGRCLGRLDKLRPGNEDRLVGLGANREDHELWRSVNQMEADGSRWKQMEADGIGLSLLFVVLVRIKIHIELSS